MARRNRGIEISIHALFLEPRSMRGHKLVLTYTGEMYTRLMGTKFYQALSDEDSRN